MAEIIRIPAGLNITCGIGDVLKLELNFKLNGVTFDLSGWTLEGENVAVQVLDAPNGLIELTFNEDVSKLGQWYLRRVTPTSKRLLAGFIQFVSTANVSTSLDPIQIDILDSPDLTIDIFSGEKGDKGDQGDQGIQGIQGTKGEDGDGTAYYAQASRITSGTISIATAGTYQSTGLTATLDTEAYGIGLGTSDTFALKNTTSENLFVKIYGSADIEASNNKILGIKLAINGNIINETECNAPTGTAASFAKLITSWMLELEPNDEVALYVTNFTNSGNITLLRGRLIATTVGRQGDKGEKGDKGDQGDVGDVNPQMFTILADAEQARDDAQLAATNADADAIATAADRVQTGLDVIATAADRVQTGLDVIQTGADRVQTGLDVVQTGADRVQTGLDVIATAADRVQTGLDVIQTGADRVQTGLDVIQTGSDKLAAQAAEAAALISANNAAASFDSFNERYLGAKSSDPTLDNDGNALIDGALYFDTVNNVLKVYDLGTTTWLRTTPTTSDQTNINTVSGSIANVNTVATNISNVNTVAGIDSDVTIVAADSIDIVTVSTNIASVVTVATNIADVITVADALNTPLSAASAVSYDNNASLLAAINVQTAIDEVVDMINNLDDVLMFIYPARCEYVDVKDCIFSDAANRTALAINSVNSGNNTGWIIA
jgi:hypothetical protein